MSAYRCHCKRHRNNKSHFCRGHQPDVKQEIRDMLNGMFEEYTREQEQLHKEEINKQKLISESIISYVLCWETGNNHQWSIPDKYGFKTCHKCDAIDMDDL